MDKSHLQYLSHAAYFTLKPYVNPVDLIEKHLFCSRGTPNWFRSNSNEKIEDLYNHKDKPRLKRFSKQLLEDHFNRYVLLGYNSGFSPRRDTFKINNGGHGRHKSLPFAAVLNVTEKRQFSYQYNLLLCCIDLDVHNGEPDVAALRDMLLEYFPEAYFEASTSGKGIHFYFKLAIHNDYDLSTIIDTIEQLKGFLVDKKTSLNILANIDKIAGLPTEIIYDKNNSCTIKRHQAIKLPLFNHSYPETNMLDIYFFHNMPHYNFQHILDILNSSAIDTANISPSVMSSPTRRKFDIESKMLFSNTDYDATINNIRVENDGLIKKRKFVLAYLQYLRVQSTSDFPTIDQIVAEYRKQELYKNVESDNNDWQSIIDYWKIHFKPLDRPSVDINSYPAQKQSIVDMLTPYFTEEDLIYKPSKSVKMEELALLYYFVRTQGDNPQSDMSVSYKKIKTIFQHYNMYSDDNKSSKMLKLLVGAGLIEMTDGYVPGQKGNSYRIRNRAGIAPEAAA